MTVTREDLELALKRALSGATFDLGRVDAEHPEGSMSSFARLASETLDPLGFRQLYERTQRGYEPSSRARTPLVRMDEASRNALVDTLRDLLNDYVDPKTDSVGHAFPMCGDCGSYATFESDGLCANPRFSSVNGVADSLARGAAVVGSDRIASLVAGWADGAPVTYRTCIVVPITLARAVSPLAGVDITPLPFSTAVLPARLPIRRGKSWADILGQTLVSVDAETTPALFRPETPNPKPGAVRAALTPPVTLETIREALSLESEAFVDWGLVWDDYGQFTALAQNEARVRGSVGHLPRFGRRTTNVETGESTLELPKDDIRDLSEKNIGQLLRELQGADGRTRVAVSRWKTAMNEIRGLPDRFIDLRIALESLFLSQNPGQELKFRLAVAGAWLVGEDSVDRRRIWDTLRSAYDLASNAVHRGDVKNKKDSALVLADALAVCRRGILRVLHEGPIADWTELILDCKDG